MIYYSTAKNRKERRKNLPETQKTLKLINENTTLCICKMLYYRQALIKPGGKIPVLFDSVVLLAVLL